MESLCREKARLLIVFPTWNVPSILSSRKQGEGEMKLKEDSKIHNTTLQLWKNFGHYILLPGGISFRYPSKIRRL